jgi:uncharacterized membrane protein YiaA
MHKPSFAFIAVSWIAASAGVIAYITALWNSTVLTWSDKNFFIAVLVLASYASISVQKIVRDRIENIPFTNLYYGVSWIALIAALILFANGLFNVNLSGNEKGFYAMALGLTLFGAIAIQKNTRDTRGAGDGQSPPKSSE